MQSATSRARYRALAILLLTLLAALIWLWVDYGQRSSVAPQTRAPTESSAATAATGAAPDPGPTATVRSAVGTTPASEPASAAEATVTIRGRCVAADGDAPLTGCSAMLRVEASPDSEKLPWLTGSGVKEMVTSSDGKFELAIPHDDWLHVVALRLHAHGMVQYSARWPRPRRGSVIDLGDIAMARAIPVTGIIVDRQGLPVADAGMMFVHIQLDETSAAAPQRTLRARSDQAGRFAFPLPAYAAEWWIAAEDTGALIEPRSVKLNAELTEYLLRVVVERPDPSFSITGRVVDVDQQPLANMRLSATGEGWVGRGRSDIDGQFTLRRAGPMPDRGNKGTALSCSDPDGMYELLQPTANERIAWSTSGVEVVMRRKASRSVLVVDPQGQPVTDYVLFVLRGKQQLMHIMSSRGTHPGGRTELHGLASGSHGLVVVPRNAELGSTEVVPFVVDGDVPVGVLPVTLQARVPLRVRLTFGDGAVVAGSTVQLLQSFVPEPPSPVGKTVELRDLDAANRTPPDVVVATAVTAADGIAELRAPVGSWHVRITGADHLAIVEPVHVAPPGSQLQLAVQPAAALHGVLEPAELLATLRGLAHAGEVPIAVVLTPSDAPALPAAPVGDDGRYAIRGVPPASYQVGLRYWLRTSAVRSSYVVMPAGKVTLAAGERRELSIDVSAMLPGTVSGRVLAGGEPLRDVHCFLRRLALPGEQDGKLLMLRVATDSDGRYTGLAPPGHYSFDITYPSQPGPGWVHMLLRDEWDLAPGATQVVNFDVPLRRVRLRLLDAGDQPVPNVRVAVVPGRHMHPGSMTTDEQGWVEIFPTPVDAFEVYADLAGGKQRLGPIDLAPGQTEGEVVLRIQ